MGHLEAEPVAEGGGDEEAEGIVGRGMVGSSCNEGGVGRESGR